MTSPVEVIDARSVRCYAIQPLLQNGEPDGPLMRCSGGGDGPALFSSERNAVSMGGSCPSVRRFRVVPLLLRRLAEEEPGRVYGLADALAAYEERFAPDRPRRAMRSVAR